MDRQLLKVRARTARKKPTLVLIRTPLDETHIEKHFQGIVGAGAIPITSKNTCRFGCIDVDVYPLDHAELVRACAGIDVPAVVCRSKSGGAHVYFFIEGWIAASDMRDKLSEIAASLGYGSAEIFPKQEKLLIDRGDVGNFINLPYFDVDQNASPCFQLRVKNSRSNNS